MREDCEHFADQFFDKVCMVEETFHRDFFLSWFGCLSPAFLKRPCDLERMKALLTQFENTDKTLFVKLLKEEIDDLESLIAMATNNE